MRALIAILGLAGAERGFFDRREVDFWDARRPAPPSGLWADAAAPPPVLRLLDAPTPENARAYLAWQEERLKRLRAAIVAVERAGAAPILYFARDGCRGCALQEKELEGLPVTRVPAGSPLWEEHGIAVTPTLIVRGRTFRGLTARDAILEELRHD